MPAVLPMSLPAGALTLRFRQRAVTVPVLIMPDDPTLSGCYSARWTFNQLAPQPKPGSFYGPVAAFSIDWSTTL